MKGATEKMNLYTVSSTEEFIGKMIEKGWELIQLSEGSLGVGDCVLLAPDDRHYNFVIREKFVNTWSSGQTIRRCAKISGALQKEIDAAEERMRAEEERGA